MKIIIDTTCDFSKEEIKDLDIIALPLQVNFEDGSYDDLFGMTPAEFYEKMRDVTSLPTTSLLGVGTFKDTFDKYPNEKILVITLAASLSGTNHSAHMAKEHSGREDITIVDSGSVTAAGAILALEAVKMRDEGKSVAEIAAKLEEIAPRLRVVAVVETLKNLIMGGRLSSGAGMIASALSIKPIIMVKDGVIESAGKARGTKAAMKKLAEIVASEGIDPNYAPRYVHANNPAGAEALTEIVGVPGEIGWLGSVMGAHAGEGASAICFVAKK